MGMNMRDVAAGEDKGSPINTEQTPMSLCDSLTEHDNGARDPRRQIIEIGKMLASNDLRMARSDRADIQTCNKVAILADDMRWYFTASDGAEDAR